MVGSKSGRLSVLDPFRWRIRRTLCGGRASRARRILLLLVLTVVVSLAIAFVQMAVGLREGDDQAVTFAALYVTVGGSTCAVLLLHRRRWFLRLHALGDAQRRWAAGDWTPRMVADGDDELADLANAFNRMATRMQAADAELEGQKALREQELRRYAAMVGVARVLAVESDLDRLLDAIVPLAVQVVEAEHGSVTRWDEARKVLVTARWTIPNAPARFEIPLGQGAAGLVALRRTPVILNEYVGAVAPGHPAQHAGVRAAMAVPLVHEGRFVGTLGVGNRAVGARFTEADVHTLELFGSLAAPTLVGLEREKELEVAAGTDALTGLANRRRGTEQIEQLLSLAARHQLPVALAVLDIDHFKRVNDVYGHARGDEVLRRLGALLRAAVRAEDCVARWGGEEFVVCMYDSTAAEGVQRLLKVLERLHRETIQTTDGTPIRVTFSAGVAEARQDGGTLDSLCAVADVALYRAKAEGRARVLEAARAAEEPLVSVPAVIVPSGQRP